MAWYFGIWRVVLALAVGGILGLYLQNVLLGMVIALVVVLLYWSHRMWQLSQWLDDPQQPPPDIHGNWGDVIAHIHRQQRLSASSQENLQSTVDYLLESFSAMRDGVVIVEGEQGGIRWCNKAAERLLGLQYPQDTGQAITNLVREPQFAEYLGQGEYSEPLGFSREGGTRQHLQLSVTPFAKGDRLLFLRDITERTYLEQMRRDFVGNVSHELRTPLTVITGYLGTFLDSDQALPANMVRPLEQMSHQTDRMESLLADLLWLSRIESEEQQEKNTPVDVIALLEELKEEVSQSHPGRDVQLLLECSDSVPGDYRQLYSAASNLLLNALKYSTEDSPVKVHWRKQGDELLHLVVSDEGSGIAETHLNRLTERFYRVDDSRNSATGGTGLGLAIVKHVAVAHNAELKIESALGKGSTFTLVFPVTTRQAE